MKKIIIIAAILMAVAIPVTAHAFGGCIPIIYSVKGHLEELGDDWWWIECDGWGNINCLLDIYSVCTTPVQDFEGYAYEDNLYYCFYSTLTLPSDYTNDDEGTMIMRWNKAELDASIEAYCESP